MVIIIVADNYAQYVKYRKYQFPYYPIDISEKDFVFISTENVDRARGLQRGNVYIHLSGELPEWFTQRFTKLEIKDTPRHHSFGWEK